MKFIEFYLIICLLNHTLDIKVILGRIDMDYSYFYRVNEMVKSKKIVVLICFLILFLLFLLFLFNRERSEKPVYSNFTKPMVIAHRGGNTFPENTLLAFAYSESIGVDMIEFDLHMTKDGHLVVIHDDTVDRTTNGTGRVDSFTLNEIKQLDAACTFKDGKGSFPYRGKGVTIPTLEEVFEAFPHMYMNIEIKDRYPASNPKIENQVWHLIQRYGMEDKVIVSSFKQEIVNKINLLSNGAIATSAGVKKATTYTILQKLYLEWLYFASNDAFHIPTTSKNVDLTTKRFIESAQNLNIKVVYWTINNEHEMRRLIALGVDGIITDKPELLLEILTDMELR